jgi:ketosteroid isomerase-like protein
MIQIEPQSDFKPAWLLQFVDIYSRLSTDNIALIGELYTDDVEFCDASTSLKGIEQLQTYFYDLYTHVTSCTFEITETFYQADSAAVYWTMTMAHKRLNKGQPVKVDGHSLIRGSGNRVYFHKDYLDLGAMVYEHLPVLGPFIKAIKKRMS